jgi:hypothetical protein
MTTLFSYIAYTYGGKWWTRVVMEQSNYNSNYLLKFMHPGGPSPSFHWPQKDDICCIEMESILKVIQPSTTGTGCQYILHEMIQKLKDFFRSTAISQYTSNQFEFLLIRDAQINTCLSMYELFSLIQAPASRKPLVVPGASSREVMGN